MTERDQTDITVVGCINTDLVAYTCRMPFEGETVFASKLEFHFGGKGANQAIQASMLFHTDTPTEKVELDCPFDGTMRKQESEDSKRSTAMPHSQSFDKNWRGPTAHAKVAVVGRIGRDSAGKCFLRHFASHQIDCSGVFLDDEHPTGVAVITVADDGANSIVYVPGANSSIEEGFAEEEPTAGLLRSSKVVVSDNGILGTSTLECFRFAKAENPRVLTVYTAAPTKAVLHELACYTDFFIVNHLEAMDLLRLWGGDEAAENLIDDAQVAQTLGEVIKETANSFPCGLCARGNVIMTNGPRPCAVYTQGSVTLIPLARAVKEEEIVDTTGAGDSFTGAFAYFLLSNPDNPAAAVLKATFVASESIKKKGSCESYAGRAAFPPELFE